MSEQDLLHQARVYLGLIHKRRGMLITCLSLSLVTAVVYNYTARPVYRATAQILIDRDAPNVLPTKEVTDLGQSGADSFQTQLELLRGRQLAERVVDKLKLQTNAELQTGPLLSPWERFERRVLGRVPVTSSGGENLPLSPFVSAFLSRLTVEPVRGSRLVNLRFDAYDPKLSAQAANAVAQTFIEQSLEFRYTTSSEATDWLTERVKDQKAKVEASEQALQAYREREKLVNVEERQGIVDQKLQMLTGAVLTARTERITKETLYTQMRSLPPSQLETFPIILSSGVVQELRSRRSELQRQQDQLSQTLGEKHPDMVRVRAEITANQERLQAEMQNVVRSVESDYRTAAQQEANLQANLEAVKQEALDLNRKAIDYNVLKREADTNQQLYRELSNRTGETGLESELRSTNVRIVERAEAPRAPALPRRARNYQIALLIGLGLGIGLSLLIEHFDNTFKTPEDLKEHLGLPFLGVVPDVAGKTQQAGNRGAPAVHRNQQSAVSEAYRVLRTNLLFSSTQGTGRALLVTSANPGEGKTTTTVNLAESLAHNGARVLAVDADLRRPALHQHFGAPKTPGLSDLIVGKCQPSQAIQTTNTKGLQILPCGYVPPNPAELLGSNSMREVIQALREHYDWVLIDTPPVLAMADTSVVCPVVDGIVFVVGAEIGSRPTVRRAVDQLTSVGGKIIGVVLNKVDLARNAYYYGQYYGEYYRSYYSDQAAAPAKRVVPGPRPIRRS